MHMVDDAPPAIALRVVPQAGASGRDAGVGRDAGHLREDQARAAHGAGAQMREVVVRRLAVDAGVLRHRRDDDPVLQRRAAQRERREHRRRGAVQARAARQPGLVFADITRIAQAQVLVRDPLRARQQRVRELLRRQARVAVDVLEPLGRIARRVLDAQHLDRARGFVFVERRGQALHAATVAFDVAGQRDRILQRELGARADREMRRVRRVAHQHHRRAAVVMHPALADDPREADPLRRSAQVRRVGDQRMAVQHLGEEPLAEGDAVLLAHVLQAGGLPHRLGRLDDEGRVRLVEAVGVRLEPAPFGLLEVEGEGVEELGGAQPDEAALPQVDVGLVGRGVLLAQAAVEAVGRDDQVGIDVRVVDDLGLVADRDAQLLAARAQDVQQLAAADAAEAMPARDHGAAVDVDGDVVPMVEGLQDLLGGLGIGLAQRRQRLIGEHHAPAEGVAGAVALQHRDLMGGVLPLHQQGEVQAGGAAADAGDAHVSEARSRRPMTA